MIMMNIVIGIAVCAAALALKFKYRPEGSNAAQLFFMAFGAGVIMMLTINSLSGFGSFVLMILEAVLCAVLVMAYRAEGMRQLVCRKERSKVRRREAAKAIEFQAVMSAPRSRSSVIVFSDAHDNVAA